MENRGFWVRERRAGRDLAEMSWLIVGLGSVGCRHLQNLLSLGMANITLLRTGKGTRTPVVPPSVAVETDLLRALARKPTVVVITNPTSLHMETALAAADAGCHLFIEKPIAHSWTGVRELHRRVISRRLVAVTGFQFRCHPLLREAKRWLDEKRLGAVLVCHARYREFLPGWHPGEDYRQSYSARVKLGGGPVLTLSHPFDYLRWLLGDVRAVSGTTAKLSPLEIDTEDVAQVLLHFASGALGIVELDYVQHPREHSLQIIGEEGTIDLDFQQNTLEWIPAHGADPQLLRAPADFERNTMFISEMKNLIAAILGQEDPVCSLEDGIRALEISLAVHCSTVVKQKVPVGLPLEAALPFVSQIACGLGGRTAVRPPGRSDWPA